MMAVLAASRGASMWRSTRPTRIGLLVFAMLGVACSGSSGQSSDPASAQGSETSGACDVLSKKTVENALGAGELSLVSAEQFDCAYGSAEDEAQVTFSVGILAGGLETLEAGLTNSEEVVGKKHVRSLPDIGDGAWVVDNGGGSYFGQLLVGEDALSLYIYGDPKAATAQRFDAAEAMLEEAAENL